jgi:hypothetical protein
MFYLFILLLSISITTIAINNTTAIAQVITNSVSIILQLQILNT